MDSFEKKIDIRWSDLDPNFHVLHSKYYDFGAYCRMAFFVEQGITPAFMQENNFGPILFREECIFKKEISFGDEITINLFLKSHSKDFGRWSMFHEIWKNGDILASRINIDGAWIDTVKRKLTIPPEHLHNVFNNTPRNSEFESL
ncbi:MAG: acyl-CoA thioesterase [Ferruginibacter sp.]